MIDATEPKPAVAERIWKTVNERLDPATAPVAARGRRIVSDDGAEGVAALPRADHAFSTATARPSASLLEAYRGGRLPHAWLISGPAGIGKATLAYRMARFVLAHPDPRASRRCRARPRCTSTPIIRWHGASRRRRRATSWCWSAPSTKRPASCARTSRSTTCAARSTFFGSTPGEGGWRVAIVDAVDELNSEGANALLKVLEEPPRRALLLLVSHSAARVLPTIRSRCRLLALRPLSVGDVAARRGGSDRAKRRRCRHRGRRGGRGRQRAARAHASRRRRARAAQPHRRAARAAAGGRSARAACAGRSPLRHRSGDARRLRRHRERLALRPPDGRPARMPRGSTGWRRPGRRSTSPRARPRSTISSESRWFSTSSAGLPRPRAVDTYPPSWPCTAGPPRIGAKRCAFATN